jgi:hypothetical protein
MSVLPSDDLLNPQEELQHRETMANGPENGERTFRKRGKRNSRPKSFSFSDWNVGDIPSLDRGSSITTPGIKHPTDLAVPLISEKHSEHKHSISQPLVKHE